MNSNSAHNNAQHDEAPALAAAAQFLRRHWLGVLLISAALLVPCFWHTRIEAGDLPSHVYNAWLAQLVTRGQAPGLRIASQWNNVLFDVVLLHLANLVGFSAAQKIAVPSAVLIFFWGAFAFACALARSINDAPARATLANPGANVTDPEEKAVPWLLAPCIAMFAYGYTFQMGFMNYYISLGLAFFALALLHRGRAWDWTLAAVLVPLIWLAHPLGVALLLAAGTYLLLVSRTPPRRHVYLFVAVALVILVVRLYIKGHFPISRSATGVQFEDGADQLILYGLRYAVLARVFEAFVWFGLILDALMRRKNRGWWQPYFVPLQLYALILIAAAWLPSNVRLPIYAAPVGLLTERLTSISAIFLCSLIGLIHPRKWHCVGFAAITLGFFFFLYADTARLNRMEAQVEDYARILPPGQRVVATIRRFPGSRIFIQHIVDRACIGRCFSYDNYEPSSGQFRVRADSGNNFVLGAAQADAAQLGNYVVQPQDLPLNQIYQCDADMTRLCIRPLSAGEANGAADPLAGR